MTQLAKGERPKVGDKFGWVEVIEVVKAKDYGWKGASAYKVRCDCGAVWVVRTNAFRPRPERGQKNGITACKDCSPQKRGAEIRKTDDSPAGRDVMNAYRRRAKERGYAFTLTAEEFFSIIKLPCTYCGDSLSCKRSALAEWSQDFRYTGIDRINSSLGYETGNVQPCCQWCNRAKSDKTEDEFINWVKSIAAYLLTTEGR
jgi:hypothetical protein